jgi:hypothetical protein
MDDDGIEHHADGNGMSVTFGPNSIMEAAGIDVAGWVDAAAPSDPSGLPRGLPPVPSHGKLKTKASHFKKQPQAAQRKWLVVDERGDTSVTGLTKNTLTHEMGIQLRDLRLLDPKLAMSYPSAILTRDRAMVVNLEHIKCIITTGEQAERRSRFYCFDVNSFA